MEPACAEAEQAQPPSGVTRSHKGDVGWLSHRASKNREVLHFGAQRSLCRLLHGFAILTRQVLAELLFQMILLNEAPSQVMGSSEA